MVTSFKVNDERAVTPSPFRTIEPEGTRARAALKLRDNQDELVLNGPQPLRYLQRTGSGGTDAVAKRSNANSS